MNAKILADFRDDVIHGKVNFIAPRCLAVAVNPSDVSELIKATNVRGAHLLTRDVVAAIPLSEHVFDDNIVTPLLQGLEGSARKAIRGEFEGDQHLQVSGTGAITSVTAVNTKLEWYNGTLRTLQSTNEVAGILEAQLTPEEVYNNTRIRVKFTD